MPTISGDKREERKRAEERKREERKRQERLRAEERKRDEDRARARRQEEDRKHQTRLRRQPYGADLVGVIVGVLFAAVFGVLWLLVRLAWRYPIVSALLIVVFVVLAMHGGVAH